MLTVLLQNLSPLPPRLIALASGALGRAEEWQRREVCFHPTFIASVQDRLTTILCCKYQSKRFLKWLDKSAHQSSHHRRGTYRVKS